MPLADASRLESLSAAVLGALGQRLAAIAFEQEHAALGRLADGMLVAVSRPLLERRLRARSDPAGYALRAFACDDPISEAEARAALGEVSLAPLVDAGLLVERDGRFVSPFRLRGHDGVLYFADDLASGEDAVMGGGPVTGHLLRAARPSRRVAAALDLGCGSGLCALRLARDADRVVATDINPRAMVLARVNVLLAGATNVELRQGDLFAPVAGERFDVIATQPPFVARPDGAAHAVYMHGGRRGDELLLRAFTGLASHLTRSGRAVVAAHWLLAEGEDILPRVRAALGPEPDLLLLEADGPDLDEVCIGDAAQDHRLLDEGYARDVVARRDHLDRLGVVELRPALAVVQSGEGRAGWSAVERIPPFDDLELSGIDARVAGRAVLARGPDALLAARLRLGAGVRFAVGRDGTVLVTFPRGVPRREVALDAAAHQLALCLDGTPTVATGLKRFAKDMRVPPDQGAKRYLAHVQQLVIRGVLEIASPTG